MLSISNNSFTLLPKVRLINLVITRLSLLLCMTSTWKSVYCRPHNSPSCLRLLHVVYRIQFILYSLSYTGPYNGLCSTSSDGWCLVNESLRKGGLRVNLINMKVDFHVDGIPPLMFRQKI